MRKFGKAGRSLLTVIAAAVVVALFAGGSAVAGSLVTSAKIKNNTILSKDVHNGTLRGVDIKDFSLSNRDIGVLYASVNAAGTLAHSSGGVSVAALGSGGYEVDFGRNVSQCAFVATLAYTGSGTPPAGSIGTADRSNTPTAVYVKTYNSADSGTNRGFHLTVVC